MKCSINYSRPTEEEMIAILDDYRSNPKPKETYNLRTGRKTTYSPQKKSRDDRIVEIVNNYKHIRERKEALIKQLHERGISKNDITSIIAEKRSSGYIKTVIDSNNKRISSIETDSSVVREYADKHKKR